MEKLRKRLGILLTFGMATGGTVIATPDRTGASSPRAPHGPAGPTPDGRPAPLLDGAAHALGDGPHRGGDLEQCRSSVPREAIAEVRRAYMEAFDAGRIEDVAALHTEDVVSMPAGMPAVEGRTALLDHMEASFEAAPEGFRFTFQATDLRVADGWAVERGITRGFMEGSEAEIPAGKYVLLYERDSDGCWRIAWSITNSDRARGP